MPPSLSDSLVGRASGPAGADREREREQKQEREPHPKRTHARKQRRTPRNPGSLSPTTRTRDALEALLVDLGPQIQLGLPNPKAEPSFETLPQPGHSADLEPEPRGTQISSQVCATGLPALDARLGGGFPRGRLSEISGPPSSGRTALALMLAQTTLRQGGLAGWVDLSDAFDPASAARSGVALERLLWVRPRSEKDALQSCDRLLKTEGFELVVFDCVSVSHPIPVARSRPGSRPRSTLASTERARHGSPRAPSISDVAWLRLSRLAAKTRTALVVLSQTQTPAHTQAHAPATSRLPRAPQETSATTVSVTGSRSALLLEMLPLGAHFIGSPSLLDSLETTAILRRHRSRPSGSETSLSAFFDASSDSEANPGAGADVYSDSDFDPGAGR